MTDEFNQVQRLAADVNDLYDTGLTNILVVAVAKLREQLEQNGVLPAPPNSGEER